MRTIREFFRVIVQKLELEEYLGHRDSYIKWIR